MTVRIARLLSASLLLGAGALMFAGSWQRWAGYCSAPWDSHERCYLRQYGELDFVMPVDGWIPIGSAAQLAGAALVLLALALVVVPTAMLGRRPGPFSLAATALCVPAVAVEGVATLLSGLAGEVVSLPLQSVAVWAWALLLPGLLVRLTLSAPGWATRVAGVSLLMALPVPGWLFYSMGPFDSAPWYEATCGLFLAVVGAGLVLAAVLPSRDSRGPVAHESGARVAAGATT